MACIDGKANCYRGFNMWRLQNNRYCDDIYVVFFLTLA